MRSPFRFLSWFKGATARQRAAKVIERNAMLFAADMRRPYAAIHGVLADLERETDQAARDRLVQDLTRALKPTLGKADDLLFQALEVTADQPLQTESLEPGTLLEQALRRVLAARGGPVGELEVEVRALQSRKLQGDEGRLVTALACVLDNAMAHAGTAGRLWLTCEDAEKGDRPFVALRIGNTGSYIPKDRRRLIFQPFYSGAGDAKTGLGLAVVREVVEAHGGWVHVHSSEAQGTEFVLTLPAALAPSRYKPLCPRVALKSLAARLAESFNSPRFGYA